MRSEVCLALKRVNHATRNEWRYVDVVDATYVSIVRFCENVGIDECFLLAMPSFCENVGIDEYFLRAMLLFFKNVGIECDFL